MKNLVLVTLSIISVILNSCSVSNDVASNSRLQKRKYTKGFLFEKKTNSFQSPKNSNNYTAVKKENIISTKKNKSTNFEPVNLAVDNNKLPISEDNYNEKIVTYSSSDELIITNKNIESDNSGIESKSVFIASETDTTSPDFDEDDQTEEGKSQIIALILVLLVGIIGAHRFYLGYTGIGIIQILTLGGCGIWTLIDLIMIITGDLKPKDGDYTEKL